MPMRTPNEAKGLHCPYARIREGGATTTAAVNRSPDGTSKGGALCLADSCMSWGWMNSDKKKGDCRLMIPSEAM